MKRLFGVGCRRDVVLHSSDGEELHASQEVTKATTCNAPDVLHICHVTVAVARRVAVPAMRLVVAASWVALCIHVRMHLYHWQKIPPQSSVRRIGAGSQEFQCIASDSEESSGYVYQLLAWAILRIM